MPVAWRSSTAAGTTNPTTSFTITIPAGTQTGDDLYVAATSRDHTSGTAFATCTDNDTGGNTWTNLHSPSDRRTYLFWKKATSATASKTITVSGCVGSSSGVLQVFSGGAPGDPTTDIGTESNSAGDETHATITPSQADSMVVMAVHNVANDEAVTTPSWATLGAGQNFIEKLSTGGSDCATAMTNRLQSGGPSATGSFTWAQANNTVRTVIFCIKPPILVTPTTLALTTTTFAATIAHTITGASPTALALTTFAPTVTVLSPVVVTPTTASLTASTFAPTVTAPALSTPTTASLTTSTFAPVLNLGLTPTTASLTTTTFEPTVIAHALATPTTVSTVLTSFAPTVTTTDHKTATPDTASLVAASFAPTVAASDHKIVIPDLATLTTATFEPSVNIGANVTPAAGILALATFAPVATWTDNQLATPDAAVLSLSAFAPGVATPQTFTPSTAALILAAFAPKAIEGGPITFIDSDLDAGPIVDGELDAGPGISGSVGAVRIRARLVVSPPPASGSIDVD